MDLQGKKVAITGAFTAMKRSEAQARLEALGADVTSGVSSKTQLLVAGAKAGSKLAKAQKLGIPIWDEARLVEILAGGPEPATAPEAAAPVEDVPQALAGKNVVLTGTFHTMKRSEAAALCKAAGATVGSGVTKKTDILVAGAKAGSKLTKAQQLGITILSEAELYQMLGKEGPKGPDLEGPMHDWLARFQAMVKELRANPEVEILNLYVGMPASEARIEEVEKRLGVTLHPAIKNFYRQCDGLSLRWIHKGHESYEHKAQAKAGLLEPYDMSSGADTGGYLIHPIRDCFITNNYKDVLYFDHDQDRTETWNGVEYPAMKFGKSLRPFDEFSHYRIFGFVMLDGGGNPAVAMGDDYGACWTDCTVTDFESYMETTLAHYAMGLHRKLIFGSRMCDYGKTREYYTKDHWDQNPQDLNALLDGWYHR